MKFLQTRVYILRSVYHIYIYTLGLIQNFADWCGHLHRRGLCIKNLSQQAKLWIPGSTTKFCGDCVKKCEDIVPNFGENRPGCFTVTTHRLTLPSLPTSFWRITKLFLSPTNRNPLIWLPVTSSYFLKWNWSWQDAGSIPLRRSRPKHRKCLTLLTGKDFQEAFQKWRRRWDRCLHARGNYFEGDGSR